MKMVKDDYLKQKAGFCTRACHSGQDSENWSFREVVPPISTSTTYKQTEPGQHMQFEYSRGGNPSRYVLESCLASLEGSKHALCFSSGSGATTTLLFLLNSGDNIVYCDDINNASRLSFTRCATSMNITTTFVDPHDYDQLEEAIQPNTKMLWMESPTGPLLKVIDIRRIVSIVQKFKDVIIVADNSCLTPYFQKPTELGAHITVYSLGKYVNGHSDVVMGAICTNSDELHRRIQYLQKNLGAVPSPFDCYQVNRSLKTLALRMEQHMKAGLMVGRFLESHAQVDRVIHPGLPSHPQHVLLKKQCYGYNGLVSFYLKGGIKESKKFVSALKLFALADDIGSCVSLVEIPALMSHGVEAEEDKNKAGILSSLIKLSVGLEDPDDLINDLDQAFKLLLEVKV